MCGIVGYTGKNQAAEILLNGMQNLEYRGYDSAGITVADDKGDFYTVKTTNRVESLFKMTDELPVCSTGIGHTRWATHGKPSTDNAHPHLSENFSVVHNGIIENYLNIKEELISEGVVFKSETDTEVIPFLMEKYKNEDTVNCILHATEKLDGSYAIAVLKRQERGIIYAAKKFSPLIIGLSKNGNFVASDITAVLPFTKRVIYLEDGEVAKVERNGVTVYNSEGKEVKKQEVIIKNTAKTVDKGGFAHYMLKEIYEQPTVLERLSKKHIKNNSVVFDNINSKDFEKIDKIHIVACGSAYHAGVAGKYAFEGLAKIETLTEIASEYRYKENFADKNTLFIAVSQSGETADTIAALNFAKEKGAHTLSIVNVEDSAIARLSDNVIYTQAGAEISVATTKGYTSQLFLLYLLSIFFADIKGRLSKKEIADYLLEMQRFSEKAGKIINQSDYIKEIAKDMAKEKTVFFIGRNTDYASSLEGALKLKEISYISSETYASGELKHGTISLIEEGITVIAVNTNNRLKSKSNSNIKEVKSRGAKVIAVIRESDKNEPSLFDKTILVPDTVDLFIPILSVIPLQIYAYNVALNKGVDIDKPRNLAKSVTVE